MLEIFELLDRFEILYPDVEEYSLLRRSYTDKDMSVSKLSRSNSNQKLRSSRVLNR